MTRTSRGAAAESFEPGDFVTIVDSPGSLTWRILDVYPGPSKYGSVPAALLESGQTGRRRYATLDSLNLYRKG